MLREYDLIWDGGKKGRGLFILIKKKKKKNGIGTDLNRSCRAGEIVFFPSHRVPLSLALSLSHARAHTLAHTHTHSHGVTRAHSHAHAQAEPLSCSLQFSGNEWGATQGTVVLANDLPGSHDALNVGWAGGWRLPRREPGSNVGSHARPASNYPGAQPRGLQEAASPPFAARSSGNRRVAGGGAGWGEVGVCVGLGG